MQYFKLVRPGFVDRLIAFNELPADVLNGVRRGPSAGWPRSWRDHLGVKPAEAATAQPFYLLEYLTINNDKEKWQEISSFVKRNVDPSVRLLDKVEAMAVPVAPDASSEITVEPEDVPVIVIRKSEAPVEEVAGRRKVAA